MAQQFDVGIAIPGSLPTHPALIFNTVPVIASQLVAAQGFQALIGRDILAHCLLNYNSLIGQFTLAY